MTELKKKIEKLAEVAEEFWRNEIPGFYWIEGWEIKDLDTGEEHIQLSQATGHWSGTLEEIKKTLNRDLTQEEITILSLSRYFGPTPALKPEESRRLFQFLFPNGNGTGGWLEWDDFAKALKSFAKGNPNPFFQEKEISPKKEEVQVIRRKAIK